MQIVRAALKSPAALWVFLTSPEAGYFERLAAASRASRLPPASLIPKIITARNELSKESALHEFGIQRYPLNEAGPYWQKSPRDRVGTGIKRIILGHPFIVPEKWIDYPLTDEELKNSPWPFQVWTALGGLYSAIIRDGNAKEIDEVALALPCRDNETAEALVSLTEAVAQRGPTTNDRPYAPAEVFGTWLNILRNPKTDGAHDFVMILDQVSDNVECPARVGTYTCPMAEVLALEALKQNDNSVIREIAYFRMRPRPHTLVLAAAHFVLSSQYRQHYSLQDQANDANLLLYLTSPETADDPFHLPSSLAANDATYQRVVASFADAFKQRESFLEQSANLERPLIDSTYKTLSTATACRP